MTERIVILALHRYESREVYEMMTQIAGWKPLVVETNSYTGVLTELTRYKSPVVIMDANLGLPGSEDIQPACEVLEVLAARDYVNHFVAVSNRPSTVRLCDKNNVPARDTTDFVSEFEDFLHRAA